jgi:predicted GNAT family N-acyltransferase
MNAVAPRDAPGVVEVSMVRTLDDFMAMVTVRSLVYVGEQCCPYVEEFDGNDLSGATHLIARIDGEPVGAMRMRWFADFAKIERVAVRQDRRTGRVAAALVRMALDLAARKGYRKVLGHIQARLLRYWQRTADVKLRAARPRFEFSDYEYVEIERDLEPPANAIGLETPAMVLLRPEGDWDRPGVLDLSQQRTLSGQGRAR